MFGKSIYYFILRVFIYKTRHFFQKSILIWPRNSFYQKYFRFLKSDLDITIFDKSGVLNSSEYSSIITQTNSFLIIKEVNFYSQSSFNRAIELMNTYELKRDPHLFRLVNGKPDSLKNNCKVTYLLRILDSLLMKLNFPIIGREHEKILFHLMNVGKKDLPTVNNLEELIEVCFLDLFDKRNQVDCIKTIFFYFQKRMTGLSDDQILNLVKDRETLILLFPHKYCYVSLPRPSELSFFLEEIFKNQIRWELWAMLTQPLMYVKNENTKKHLVNLLNLQINISVDQELASQGDWVVNYLNVNFS